MTDFEQLVTNLLINENYYSKALIKYEIKQLESQLQRKLRDAGNCQLRSQEAAKYCFDLQQLYENFLALITKPSLAKTKRNSIGSKKDTENYFTKIQVLQRRFSLVKNREEEINLICQLISYYHHFHHQLMTAEAPTLDLIQQSLTQKLNLMMDSVTPKDWLIAVVALANEAGEYLIVPLTMIAQLNDKELHYLSDLFKSPDFVFLINSIYCYKLEPQKLFKQLPHPEKLVSVKARLSMLHHFIEMIHQALMSALQARGEEPHDDLFHDNELPRGITIDFDQEVSQLIIAALKQWRLHQLIDPVDLMNKNKLYDLFRSYKFWFNPNRLIDTLMTLQRRLSGDELDASHQKLLQQIRLFYHQLSTSECLELYGYFANKDTSYLLRTLSAALLGQLGSLLPCLTKSEHKIIEKVYDILTSALQAIREELVTRHIVTPDYISNNMRAVIKPGRRNLNAVKRIMDLYCNQQATRNLLIEQLFKEIE